MSKLFGPDGIRGRANEYPITSEIALRLGQAIASLFLMKGRKKPRAIIGKDTRLSGYMLETALTSGLVSMGMDVFEIGPMPTPAVAHLTRSMCADCGIMITASSSPAGDNGIKLCDGSGCSLSPEDERQIEMDVLAVGKGLRLPGPAQIGKAFRIDDARGRYIEFAKSSIHNHSLCGIKAVLDCANGAAYYIAPLILKELGVDVIRTATSPDGYNINDKCGLVCPQNMIRLVREHKADIGISLDGDADRVLFCGHDGAVISGDRIMGLCILDYLARGRLAHNTAALTDMCSLGLIQTLEEAGVRTRITLPGEVALMDCMRKENLNFGGDPSGKFIFGDYATAGDGIISALHVINIMKSKNKTLTELTAGIMTDFPRRTLCLPVRENIPLESLSHLTRILSEANAALGRNGRVFVRYSASKSQCRVLVETKSAEETEKWYNTVCDVLGKELT